MTVLIPKSSTSLKGVNSLIASSLGDGSGWLISKSQPVQHNLTKRGGTALTNKVKNVFPLLIGSGPIVLLYLTLGCPIKFFTGLSCFGCGMSRAVCSLLRLDIAQAIYFHPLVFIMPLVAVILLFKNRLSKGVRKIVLWTVLALFIIVYIYRLFFLGSDIVCFEPQNSFIYQFFCRK